MWTQCLPVDAVGVPVLCHCDRCFVVATFALSLRPLLCHCDLCFVIATFALSLRATTRNPVSAWHGIPDVETPDLSRGRDDKP